jgi:hypothetical protein
LLNPGSVIVVGQAKNRSVLIFELIGMVFIIIMGSALHFAFEWSGSQAIVGVFSAVNESVWEHLKLAFWPALLFMFIECALLKRTVNNLAFAKTVGVYVMVVTIPLIFYSYTAIIGDNFFMDILTFVIAVITGQLVSYILLTQKKLPQYFNTVALFALVMLVLAFVLFTFYPPRLSIFMDPRNGTFGIPVSP